MQDRSGNLPRSLLVMATIAAILASPVILLGQAMPHGEHAFCVATGDGWGSSQAQKQSKTCCPQKTHSDERCPIPQRDGSTPCDDQSCQCCLVVCVGSAAATFTASGDALPDLPSSLVRASVESFVPFLWVDSLLRPPQF